MFYSIYVTLEHKTSLTGTFIAIGNNTLTVWVQFIDFSFMQKIIRILRSCFMTIISECPTYKWKIHFWLVICIAKNFIWTTLKMIFSIFRFFCSLRFQIYKYCPLITNHTSMEILCTQLSDDVWISMLKNWPLWLVLWVTHIKKKHQCFFNLLLVCKKTIESLNETAEDSGTVHSSQRTGRIIHVHSLTVFIITLLKSVPTQTYSSSIDQIKTTNVVRRWSHVTMMN